MKINDWSFYSITICSVRDTGGQERLELSLPPLFTMYKNLSEERLEALLYKYIPLGPLYGGNDAPQCLSASHHFEHAVSASAITYTILILIQNVFQSTQFLHYCFAINIIIIHNNYK